MRYTLENGKTIIIPDKELEKNMKLLDLDKQQALELWLEDNDYKVNEEQAELQAKAEKVKVNVGARASQPHKQSKPRTIHISDEKRELFNQLSHFLDTFCAENNANYTILTENKLFQVQFGNKTFKIDLIQQRNKKKS